jgi:hypothetical protein
MLGAERGLLRPRRAHRAALASAAIAAVLALVASVLLVVHGGFVLLSGGECCAVLHDPGTRLFWGDAKQALIPDDEQDAVDRDTDVGVGEDFGLHAEAEKALALCDELLADGERRRCVHKAFHDTQYTGTYAGQNNWEQNSMAISLQKVIDQFKPDMDHLMQDGKLTKVPVYDRSAFRRHHSTGYSGKEIFDPDQSADEYVAMTALGIKSHDKESEWEKEMGYDEPSSGSSKRARPRQLRPTQARMQGLWEGIMPVYTAGGPMGEYTGSEPGFPSVTRAGPASVAPARVEELPPQEIARVEDAVVVGQPWADGAHLTRQTVIELDPARGEAERFHVDVEGVPVGCGAPAGTERWSGDLTVEDASCGDGLTVTEAS